MCRSTVRNQDENQRQHLAGHKSALIYSHVVRAWDGAIWHTVAGWGDCLLSGLRLLSSWQRHSQASASVPSLIFSLKLTTMCPCKVITVSWYMGWCFLCSSKMFPCCFHRDVTLQQGRELGVGSPKVGLKKLLHIQRRSCLFFKRCVEISVTNPYH